MIIDLDELDSMPSDVLRGIQQLIRDEMEFRSEQAKLNTAYSQHIHYTNLAISTKRKHHHNLAKALERWNAPQEQEGVF